jgi:hypothetical protein
MSRSPQPPSPRRPLTRLTALGLAAHVFFELGAGVGMPAASFVGPRPAALLWGVGASRVVRAAGARDTSADSRLALVNGFALAAVTAHLLAWSRGRTRVGLPWLIDCERLGPELMPAYNTMIYLTAASALAGLAAENRSEPTCRPLLAVLVAPALAAMQHLEVRRLTEQANQRPAWWNRRLQHGPRR